MKLNAWKISSALAIAGSILGFVNNFLMIFSNSMALRIRNAGFFVDGDFLKILTGQLNYYFGNYLWLSTIIGYSISYFLAGLCFVWIYNKLANNSSAEQGVKI